MPENTDRAASVEDNSNQLWEDKIENAFLLLGQELDGLPDRTGNRSALGLKLTYAETGEDYIKGQLKTQKFFMSKYDALRLADAIKIACSDGVWEAPPTH